MKQLCIFLAALLILALAGCGAGKTSEEKLAEKMIEDAVGGDASVEMEGDKYTIEYGDGQRVEMGGTEWPTDEAAAFIPKADFGTVTACTIMGSIYAIDLEDVSQKDAEGYLQAAKDAGFTETAITTQEEGYLQYQAADAGGNYLVLSYEAEVKILKLMATAYTEQ